VKTVGLSLEPVKTIGGLPILPGGSGWQDGEYDQVVEKAKEFLSVDVPVAAICWATAGLARDGVLDEVCHTSNAQIYLQWTNYGGTALYQDSPAVTDGNVITAKEERSLEAFILDF